MESKRPHPEDTSRDFGPKAKLVDIYFIPPKISPRALKANNKLLSDEQIKAVISLIPIEKNMRHKKKEINQKLGIIRTAQIGSIGYDISYVNGQYYAIYLGAKRGAHLGAGSFGVAKLAQNIQTGEWVTLKTVKTKKVRKITDTHIVNIDRRTYIENENKMLEKARKLKGFYERPNKKGEIQCETFMEYESGTTLEAVSFSQREIPVTKLFDISLQLLADAENMLKNNRILHMDIKGANIICGTNKTRLIDYGLAKEMGQDDTIQAGYRGTFEYAAPEVYSKYTDNDKTPITYSEKTEICSLAITLGKLFGVKFNRKDCKFEFYNPITLNEKDSNILNVFPIRLKTSHSQAGLEIVKILNEMVDEKPDKRPTVKETIEKIKQIRTKSLDNFSMIVKIAYIDPVEFNGMTSEERAKTIQILNAVDEVRFIGQTEENDPQAYSQVKQRFEKSGFIVTDQLIQFNNIEELTNTLKEQTEPNHIHYLVSNNSSFNKTLTEATDIIPIKIDPTKKIESLALLQRGLGLPISHVTLAAIIEKLVAEKSRLEKQNKSDRATLVDETIKHLTKLTSHQTTQYALVAYYLESLEHEIKHYKVGEVSKTQTSKIVHGLIKELYQSLNPAIGWAISEEKEPLDNKITADNKYILKLRHHKASVKEEKAPNINEMEPGVLYIGTIGSGQNKLLRAFVARDNQVEILTLSSLDSKIKESIKNKLDNLDSVLTEKEAHDIFLITSKEGYNRRYLNLDQQMLLDAVTAAVQNPLWKKAGEGILGTTITPSGIKTLREKLLAKEGITDQDKLDLIISIISEKAERNLPQSKTLTSLQDVFYRAIYKYIKLLEFNTGTTDKEALRAALLEQLNIIRNPSQSNKPSITTFHFLAAPEQKDPAPATPAPEADSNVLTPPESDKPLDKMSNGQILSNKK